MKRAIAAFIVGLVAWILIVSLLDRGLRLAVPGYHAAEPAMHFTLLMKIARLSIGALTSLIVGVIVRAIAPASAIAPWAVGIALLALFIPEHVKIWALFPIWYHLTFLVTLAPLIALGARLYRPATPKTA